MAHDMLATLFETAIEVDCQHFGTIPYSQVATSMHTVSLFWLELFMVSTGWKDLAK